MRQMALEHEVRGRGGELPASVAKHEGDNGGDEEQGNSSEGPDDDGDVRLRLAVVRGP